MEWIGTNCACHQVVFFKTQPPIEPVSFVHRICADAADSAARKRSRFIKRLTPISLLGPATEKGLEEVCERVLAPHFHSGGGTQKKVSTPAQHTADA